MSVELFGSQFLIPHAARQNWHDKPRLPFNRAQHCMV
jgi:hypothetical protein